MTSLKRTQALWLIRMRGAWVLSVLARLALVRVPMAGILAALSRLAQERVPMAGSKR